MLPSIAVSSLDFERLENLLDRLPSAGLDIKNRLWSELDRADLLDPRQVPANLVTMNSRVTFTVFPSQNTMTRTLVYPKDCVNHEEHISILTPLGSALLGLSVHQQIEWQIDSATRMSVRIDAIDYQPERAGDYHL